MLTSKADARRAALLLFFSSFLFAAMALATKMVARRLPGPQAAMIRFGAGVLAAGVGVLAGRIVIRPQRWGWLITRGLFGGVAVLTYFMCIQRVPVGVATLLNQTHPIFTLMFAWLLLGERPTRAAVIALPLTTAGVAIIVGVRVSQLHVGTGEALGVVSALVSGVAVTSIRAARRDSGDGRPADSAWSVFFSFTFLGLLVTIPFALPPFGAWVAPTLPEWGWLLAVGLCGVSAQVMMTDALRHIGGATAGIISQFMVLLTIGGGAVFFGDHLTISFLIGGALTLTGVVLALSTTSPRQPPLISTD
jgi:drug/metabolite transporter (DMT)-like permease